VDIEQGPITRTLMEQMRQLRSADPEGLEEAFEAADGYAGSYWGCIREVQRDPKLVKSNGECLNKQAEQWAQYVARIKSIMLPMPADVYVTSVMEEAMDISIGTRTLPHFVSATFNFSAMDNARFHNFREWRERDDVVILALHLKPGARALPIYAENYREGFLHEYELLVDSDQTITITRVEIVEEGTGPVAWRRRPRPHRIVWATV
jgi:hypothetical protein